MFVNSETNSGRSAKTLFKFTLAANVPQKRVEWHLPAKVRLKKSHFGKQSFTECALRHPPCQSELAEAPTTFCGTHESPSKTKATGRSSARAKMPDSLASQQYTMIFFVPVRGVSLLRAPTTANKTQRPTVTENKMAFCKKWKQMADRNGTPLASGGRGNWTWRSPP